MYLSKSDFKVARSCATKLYYKKLDYLSVRDDDAYLRFLADGGYMIEAIAKAAGVNVVACTGIWIDIPRWFSTASVEEIADVFAREIETGIADTKIRAGIIKVANNREPGIGELQDKVLRGAAQAAMRTGVPITTHTNPYDIGRDQMLVFDDTGLPPHLLAIGHSFTSDIAYLREVLEGGRYLSIDNFKPGREGEDGVLGEPPIRTAGKA